ncbi:transcription initiation factor IIE subunit beta-like [Portunus trituberculatus]|uniref:transcription initiation factor IIE subunit beta-like n=1 Tax=Portunus trituberculatus TaxID=210409 RepID=UPI001E1CC5C0|nr:transcription initiation factor IIE subunit beta-like [Portunus trituberculatus]
MDPRHILPELPPSRGLLVDAGRSSIVQCRTYPKYISSFSQHRHSKCKFSVLRTIVNFLKMRYQEKNTEHYTFEEMTRKAGLLHLDPEVKKWLVTEALPHNLKVEVIEGMYYFFKPPLHITGRHSLLRLLRQKYEKGLGGVMLSDVQECVGPRWNKIMKQVEGEVVQVVRKADKKTIIFHKDNSLSLPLSEELVRLWRSLSLSDSNKTDDDIETYLLQEGFNATQITKTKRFLFTNTKETRKAKQFAITKAHAGL